MKKPTSIFIILFFGIMQGQCQTPSEADSKTSVLKEAEKMCAALFSGDFQTYVNYTHPRLIEMIGGRDKFIEVLETNLEKLKADGSKIISVKIVSASKSVACNGEMQCVLKQELTMSYSGKKTGYRYNQPHCGFQG